MVSRWIKFACVKPKHWRKSCEIWTTFIPSTSRCKTPTTSIPLTPLLYCSLTQQYVLPVENIAPGKELQHQFWNSLAAFIVECQKQASNPTLGPIPVESFIQELRLSLTRIFVPTITKVKSFFCYLFCLFFLVKFISGWHKCAQLSSSCLKLWLKLLSDTA